MRKGIGLAAVVAACALGGCLEMSQYPAWADGRYDGMPDAMPTHASDGGDRLDPNGHIGNADLPNVDGLTALS